jgi:hypothetical protein
MLRMIFKIPLLIIVFAAVAIGFFSTRAADFFYCFLLSILNYFFFLTKQKLLKNLIEIVKISMRLCEVLWKTESWQMVEMVVYGHSLRYIHHTGLLGGLNQHQSHQSLHYFTKVLGDPDRNIICDHL